MKIAKKIIKWFLYFFLIPTTYIIVSLLLSSITIERKESHSNVKKLIYLNTNGVHLDILIPIENINSFVLSDLKYNKNEKYLSFGWGDENFYINTPTWGDLTFSNAFKAMFLKSSTLMHVTRYKQKHSDWTAIKVTPSELDKLNTYLLNTFETTKNGKKIIIKNKAYSSTDNFYKSKGSYSCFNTCNSWVNNAFKESDLKSCFWTPFDFGLINKYN
ncbi:DUF2459 domain-containing protein [Psychroserpens sp. NJDZ02]|uniref:DUF2459 domain-containing protein n=1 Tax=Psychroserpens sp. NJDZ02 TaxID=2570561 RepID=UPI0010A8B310|nr:DUF2459 domain-containing protein [Psychroserpens sp. NJDZ02]QCE43184.1 DUF2459 domain-containing protein [Psychroserpens sp. NJDZ02]